MAAKIYTCESCGFVFTRTGIVELCPNCGKKMVRDANSNEIKEFEDRIKESKKC